MRQIDSLQGRKAMNLKKYFTPVKFLLLSLMIALTACGSPANNGGSNTANGNTAAGNAETPAASGKKVELTVATVNNPDMVVMQKLAKDYEQETGVTVKFSVLPENDLRKQVTLDVSTGGGKYDIVTIGNFDASIWAKNGWIEPLAPFFDGMSEEERAAYDLDDLFPSIRDGVSYENELYALPFYGESSMLYYNKEMLEKAGVTMPESPTWEEVADIAKKVKEANNVPGIILRGLPGWGEMFAPLNTVINAHGGSWYDMNWDAQLNSPETIKGVQFYVDLINAAGQPGATTTGFTEALTLLSTGKAAMWYDATVAAGFLNNPNSSQVVGKIGYAKAPTGVKENTGWLWSWNLAIEAASKNKEEAFKFITWATSKEYIEKVGESEGWVVAPPGTRQSTYENPKYKEAAPFADIVLESLLAADFKQPTVNPVPYQGVQFVNIPEFQQLGTEVSQFIAGAITGEITVEEAMNKGQEMAQKVAVDGGYKK
ncbi:ABC transporter substrate-binding protein [Paenibacillus sp. sgz302251]|uniref:ABC transporter substrate-binding protein n=1 Tax=Paenibacillus sp. sgz302251 TaxID=3414493 RepID=UPI003C7A8201